MSKVRYLGVVGGSKSGEYTNAEDARNWVNHQLDAKATASEGFVYESIERIYKVNPSIASEKLSPRADHTETLPAEKPGHDYSNEKNDRAVGSTHIGQIGAGYDFGNAPGS